MKKSIPYVLLFLLFTPAMTQATVLTFKEALKNPDPTARYFIYIHGETMETGNKEHGVSKRYGKFEYTKNIKALEKQGLTVISEIRPRVSALQYAGSIVSNTRRLLGAGVPPVSITIGGFSRGGYIALLVASSLNDPYVSYVIMAGCGRGRSGGDYAQFLRRKRGHRLQGRILSIYDVSDLDAGSCKEAFEQAGSQIQSDEIQLRTGKGHGLFFSPHPSWLLPTVTWTQ